jgi:hypothetical protein
MKTTDVLVESSPATEAAPEYLAPEQMTAEQRNNWLLKGDIPLAGESQEASPTSDEEAEESAAGVTPGETAPASQPAKSQEQKPAKPAAPRKPKTAEDRKAELNREIQSLLARKNQLTQEVETGVTRTPPTAAQPAAVQPKPAAAATQPADADARPDPRQKADGSRWKDWNEYESAKDQWLIREGVRQADRANQQRAQQAQQQQLAQTWRERCDEAASDPEMPEFQKVAFNAQLPINPATHQFIVRSPIGPKILFHLGQNPTVAAELAKCDPLTTASILGVLAYELGNRSTAAPGAKAGKPAAGAVPKTKQSRTPDPAVDLGARNSAPADEEEAAVRNDDVRGFMEIQLRKDLAHRK